MAKDLKEDERKQLEMRRVQALVEGESSPRGPEVTQRSPLRTSPLPTSSTPTTLASLTSTPAHHHPCHLHPFHFHSCPTSLLPHHPSSNLHTALCTIRPCWVEVPLCALCSLHASPPSSWGLHARHPPRTSEQHPSHCPPTSAPPPSTPPLPHPHAPLHHYSGCALPRRCFGRGGIRRVTSPSCRSSRRARSRVHAAPLGRGRGSLTLTRLTLGRRREGRACGKTHRARRSQTAHAWRLSPAAE